MVGKSKGYDGPVDEPADAGNSNSDLGQAAQNLSNAEPQKFCIEDWLVDPCSDRMIRGDETIKLEPKVMSLLVYMAERPGQLVTRSEIEESVWSEVVVGYDTVTGAIQKLRKAFRDDARAPRIIETVPKKGYRFVATVRLNGEPDAVHLIRHEVTAEVSTNERAWNVWLWAGLLVVVAAAFVGLRQPWTSDVQPATPQGALVAVSDKPSIAILPFVNMSDDRSQEYFSDGITEDLITDLSRISGLFVIARYTTFAYKESAKDAQQVGRDLGVSHVVTGSVRKAGNRVRVSVQLIDARTKRQIWANRYDREVRDVFALQDEVTQKIVSALSVRLNVNEKRRLSKYPTKNPQAYDLYLRGLRQESFFTREANLEARRQFQRAIELDPNFAAAYAHLASTFNLAQEYGWTDRGEEFASKALALAKKAVEIDKELPQAYWSLGRIYTRPPFRDHERGIKRLKRAVKLDPNFADGYAYLALAFILTGRASEALGAIEKAMRLNPQFPFWYPLTLGRSQFYLGRYEVAAKNFKLAIDRNPTVPWSHQWLLSTYGHLGRLDDAKWQISELEILGHAVTIKHLREVSAIKDPGLMKLYLDGFRKAGVPEE